MRSIRISLLFAVAALAAHAADPSLLDAYRLQQAGDYAAAADAYRAFLKLTPNEPAARSNLGVVLVKLGRYDEAIAEYEAAGKLVPGDPRIELNLALAYEKSGRLPEAAARLAALHTDQPREAQVTLLLADCYLQMGDDARVIELLRPLEDPNSTDLAMAYMLGTALLRHHHIEEGQVLLDRILRNGDSAEARFLLGTRMFESGDYPAAVKQLAGAVELNPKLPRLQAFYGLALLNTGDPDAASAAFRAELADNPSDYDANLGMGQILTARNHCGEALPLLRRALLLRPASTDAKASLSECEGGHTRSRSPQTPPGGGPAIQDLAPDFTLPRAVSGGEVRLRDFRGKTPVVLVFGSYTCPNFRAASGALNALAQKYKEQAAFLLVYIREAHASGDWQSTRNEREGVVMAPAATLAEKQDHAVACTRRLHLNFPALVDGMDGAVESKYAAWPSRAFIVGRNGRILYTTQLTELDFHADQMEAALRRAVTRK